MSRIKKILLIGNTSWSMYNFRLNVAKALKADGHTVLIAAPSDHTTALIKQEGFQFLDLQIDNKGVSPTKDLQLLWRLCKLYKRHQPDLIFHYTIKPNIYGVLAAKISKINSIAFVTGLGSTFIKPTSITRLIEQMYKISFRYAMRVWFLNQDDYNYFASNRLVNPGKAEVLNGEGVDTLKYHKYDRSRRNDDTFTFLYLGRILKDKGIIELISATRLVQKVNPHVRVKLLGFIDALNPSAISKEQVDDWIAEGIIEYLGHTTEVIPFINDADCVVLPSYREGISMTLLEAASMERPIIASNVPGCKEIVDDGYTGFLCEPRDASDLAMKMRMMLSLDKKQRDEMGAAARMKMINQFDLEHVIEKYRQIVNP